MSGNARTQITLNSVAGDFSESYVKEKIVSRLFASIALLAAATLAGCAVAPGYPAYGYAYGDPYYPGYGYAYGPYYPAYGTVGIYGGWGGCCYYRGGHGYWHGGGGHGGHGGWHGGGYGGYGGNSWSSGGGGGGHGGGHGR
jgi:hypothetical protein